MDQVMYTGLHASTLELLKHAVKNKEIIFNEVSDAEVKEVFKSLHQYHALLIGEKVGNPIRLAQDAYAQDKAISVLLINDPGNQGKIKQALQFSPFIGPTIQAVSNEAGERLAPIVEDAMQRTVQRRSFAKMKSTSVSEQRFVPNALEKVRADFTTKVLEEAPIGAVLISGTGVIFSINNYALELFHKSEKEVLGTVFSSLFPEDIGAEVKFFMLDGYQHEPRKVFEVAWPNDLQYLELSVAPIDMKASSNYKLVILNNITTNVLAQQRTQAHLEELEKLNSNLARVNADLDTFVYTASHDLKSPILNIEGLVASLEEELGPEHVAVKPELDHIKLSIGRFKQTVEGLTEVSKIQKSFEQEAVVTDMQELLDDVKLLLERELKESGAVIELNTAKNPSVFYPRRNLTSVLYNLVGNAIKYRDPNRIPFIKIDTGTEKEFYCITVRDNGLGLPVDKRERVFQLFKRMHSHVQGSGVGLYIVKRIVESNGGEITVESEEGEGTVFKVKLKQFAQN